MAPAPAPQRLGSPGCNPPRRWPAPKSAYSPQTTRYFGIAQPARRPGEREARRPHNVAHDLIPVGAHARFNEQTFARRPTVLQILRRLHAHLALKRTPGECHVSHRREVVSQNGIVVPAHVLVETGALEIHTKLDLVRARALKGGREQVSQPFIALTVAIEVLEVVSTLSEGR